MSYICSDTDRRTGSLFLLQLQPYFYKDRLLGLKRVSGTAKGKTRCSIQCPWIQEKVNSSFATFCISPITLFKQVSWDFRTRLGNLGYIDEWGWVVMCNCGLGIIHPGHLTCEHMMKSWHLCKPYDDSMNYSDGKLKHKLIIYYLIQSLQS